MSSPLGTVLTVLAAIPQAARDARVFTARALSAWELSHLTETAALLVSELVTNAIAHAGDAIDSPEALSELAGGVNPVMLGLSYQGSLLIKLWDQSSIPPRRRVAADDAESGRGLALVDALSKEWGCEVLATGGKIVWLVLETGHE